MQMLKVSKARKCTNLVTALSKYGRIDEAENAFKNIPLEQRDSTLWNAMMSCYLKDISVQKAKECFDAMQECVSRTVVTYNILIAVYAQAGQMEQAICVFEKMPSRNVVSWNEMITAYAQEGHIEAVKCLYNAMPEEHIIAKNSMIKAFAGGGFLLEAKILFENSIQKNVASWAILLHGFAENGYLEESRGIFEMMPSWNTVCCNSMLTTYASSGHMSKAISLFNEFVRSNKDSFSLNLMLKALLSCGFLVEARCVFDENTRNIISWNTMLYGYAEKNCQRDVILMYDKMPSHNVISCVAVLTAYARTGQIHHVEAFYAKMVGEKRHVMLGNVLLQVYVEHCRLDDARSVFQEMPQRSFVSWATMLRGYAEKGHFDDTKHMFCLMPAWNISSWNSMLRAYAQAGQVEELKRFFQADMKERSLLSWNTILESVSSVEEAKEYFDEMPERDLISWGLMLTAWARNGHIGIAECYFKKMPMVDLISWNIIFAGHVKASKLDHVKSFFENELPVRDIISWNILLSAYVHGGYMDDAKNCLDKMPFHGITACNTLLAGYVQNGQLENARKIFDTMADTDAFSWTTIVSGYAQNGQMAQSRQLFDSLCSSRDLCSMEFLVVLWNAVLSGYAHNCDAEGAFSLYMSMELQGIKPNAISFLCILVAFSHSGSVKDGRSCFLGMRCDHGISPLKTHYCIMVHLLARGGYLDEAEELMTTMPFLPDAIAWQALLGACKIHKDLPRAERVARHAFGLDIENATSYLLLSNVYAT